MLNRFVFPGGNDDPPALGDAMHLEMIELQVESFGWKKQLPGFGWENFRFMFKLVNPSKKMWLTFGSSVF